MLLHIDTILALFVEGRISFFSKLITFVACFLTEVQNFFLQSSPRYKSFLLSTLSKTHIVNIECLRVICSPIFVVEGFSGLFAHPSVFLISS